MKPPAAAAAAAAAPINVEGLASLIFGMHQMLAWRSHDRRWELAPQECAAMAHAGANVWRHFANTIPSAVMQDCGALLMTMAQIYVPRFWPGTAHHPLSAAHPAPPSNGAAADAAA